MNKIVILLIGLASSLAASDPFFVQYPENFTPREFSNRHSGQTYDHEVNCHLELLYTQAASLSIKDIQRTNDRRQYRMGCDLADVVHYPTGNTLLHQLVLAQGDPATALYIIDQGCDPLLPNNTGKNPYQIAQELRYEPMITALKIPTHERMSQPSAQEKPQQDDPARPSDKKPIFFKRYVLPGSILLATISFYAWWVYHKKSGKDAS